MSGLFSKPKMPPPPAPPPPPSLSSAEVRDAAERNRRRSALASGRASTMLTGGDGLADEPETARKRLLGQ